MAAKLLDKNDNVLSKSVQVMPNPDPIKIENRLLNGDYDQQIIGTAAVIYELSFFCTYANMETIQAADTTGDNIKLTHEGTTYTGKIKGTLSFNLTSRGVAANRYYKGQLSLLVPADD